ncbi:MAG TPA: hypothetical protein VD867_08190 [Burkholderiales bacterium]|nr:hypothetical protein [Burkholderiales bacterium]
MTFDEPTKAEEISSREIAIRAAIAAETSAKSADRSLRLARYALIMSVITMIIGLSAILTVVAVVD